MTPTLFPREFFAELARQRARWSFSSSGSRAIARLGTTLPGFESRPWQYGDSRRQVDWRSTARIGRTMVRRQEREQGGQLCLVLDRSASLVPRNPNRDFAQRRLALALSWLALEQGARVQIFANRELQACFSGWSRRAAVMDFLQQLPPAAGRDALPSFGGHPAGGSRLHILSDPWFRPQVFRAWAPCASRYLERSWTCLLLPQESTPPQQSLELKSMEEDGRLKVDLQKDFPSFQREWDCFRRSQESCLEEQGFRHREIYCFSASADAAELLRRCAHHAVL